MELLDLLGEIAASSSVLGFTISHPALSSTIVSTSDIDHLRSNVSIAERVHCPLTSYEEPNAAWT